MGDSLSDALFNETVIVAQSSFRQWFKKPMAVHCRRAAERDLPDGFGKGKLRGKFFKHQGATAEQISAEFSIVTRETMIKKRVFRPERA